MPKEQMWVEYDDGTHLSNSRRKPGAFSPLTRSDGTNKLGQVTLTPIEEPALRSKERSEIEELLRGLAVSATLYALERARPHVTRVMTEQVLPALKSKLQRAVTARRGGGAPDTATEPPTPAVLELPDTSQEVLTAIEPYKAGMSREEARHHP